jgi:4-O-beta-D-mannosyl-D-glucose phosphorylase
MDWAFSNPGEKGWLHLAWCAQHAAGLRYAISVHDRSFDPSKIIHRPAGYFMAPEDEESGGINVLFSNGWVAEDDGTVLIYYASSDTRQHVAFSSIDRLLDYVMNTAEDGLRSAASVETLNHIIDNNMKNNKEGAKAGQPEREIHI